MNQTHHPDPLVPTDAEIKAARAALTDAEMIGTSLTNDEARIVGWLVESLTRQVSADEHLRKEAKRIVGNGPLWASTYAWNVLSEALEGNPQ